jgi:hypothetical protein
LRLFCFVSLLVTTGDDSEFLVDRFGEFLQRTLAQGRPFYAHLCLHSIHEPHPAMPQYYRLYENDPDYLGTLTQMDAQFGRLMTMLEQEVRERLVRAIWDSQKPSICQDRLRANLENVETETFFCRALRRTPSSSTPLITGRTKAWSGPTSATQPSHCGSAKAAYLRVVPAPANVSVKRLKLRLSGSARNHKNSFETRRGSNFRPFWLESSRFYPAA